VEKNRRAIESDKMGDSKTKRKSQAKGRAKKTRAKKEKMDVKVLAIALIFVMLFVSYVVIFTTQNSPPPSKNMVFSEDQEELGTWYGKAEDIPTQDLSDVKLEIKDSSSDSTNVTELLEDGVVVETDGNFNCTFYDKNDNGNLDEEDEFVVHNANAEDSVKLYLISTDEELAYYTF
jgi:hypothetical protein